MRVGRYPPGYLELLDAKSNGATPPDVSDFVQPVLDMGRFYDQAVTRYIVGTTAAGVNACAFWGTVTAATTVPSGELWRIRQISVQFPVLAALTEYRFKAAAAYTLESRYVFGPDSAAGVATDAPLAVWNPDNLYVGGGWTFGLWAERVVLGTSASPVIRVTYDRLTN